MRYKTDVKATVPTAIVKYNVSIKWYRFTFNIINSTIGFNNTKGIMAAYKKFPDRSTDVY